MALLHIPLYDFWDYTPLEIDYAFKYYSEKISIDSQIDWERTRLNIYYSYLYVPSKKQKVNYEQFKKDFLPFNFDKPKEIIPMSDETFDYIATYFDNSKEGSD